MTTFTPMVVDISHHNPVSSFSMAHLSGILGVIHKATQGTGNTDPRYASRRPAAIGAGMLWGAYHFNSGQAIPTQVQHFLDAAKPDKDTLMALDFEDNRASQMSLDQARDFLDRLDKALGRKAWIYSGNRIKETIVHADAETRAFFGAHRFWLCQYGPVAKMVDANGHPLPWTKYDLWQYTGDGVGSLPHSVNGIPVNGLDLNRFDGKPEDLTKIWASPSPTKGP